MKMRFSTIRGRFSALLLALGLLLGSGHAARAQQGAAVQGLGPGIHPVLVVAGRTGSTVRMELYLNRVDVPALIGSYQGEIGYDTGALTLNRAELPRGITGAWNEVSPGRVRFAGITIQGVASGPVLVLDFTARGPVAAEGFTLRMKEVAAAGDYANLAPRLVAREHPILSNTPAS
ncbi:MAG: hypothetical protein JO040_14585 [Gemmatimonadetes bacterium]|nr:hypothetical protein [Gemmatimonadota bacterium]